MKAFYKQLVDGFSFASGVAKVLHLAFVEIFRGKPLLVNKKLSLCLFLSLFVLSEKVFAIAGDLISSTATMNYDIAGSPSSTDATASFREDRRINFSVASADGGSAVPVISDMTNAVMQFTVTNTGNAVQDFLLTALNTSPNPFGSPVDNFDPLPGSVRVFVENGTTPGYQAAEDTGVFIDELNINASSTVYVVANIPSVADDDVAAMALVAQVAEGGAAAAEGTAINADDNNAVSSAGTFSNSGTNVAAGIPNSSPDNVNSMETVFNDPAGLNTEDISTISPAAQDIARNGQASDAGAYRVSPPVLIAKSVTVIDTQGGNDPHPGATLRYQLQVDVAGNNAVDNLVITDAIPANTTYVDGSILLNGVAQTDANDQPTDYSQANNFPVTPIISIEVDLSENGTVAVAPGVSNTIIFEVTIN